MASINILTDMAILHMRVMKCWGWAAGMLLFSAFSIMGADTPAPEWSIVDGNKFVSKSLKLGTLMQLTVDGRTMVATSNAPKTTTPPPEDPFAPKLSDPRDSVPIPRLSFTFDGKPISVMRRMIFDAKRNALLIVDVFTNREAEERSMQVVYNSTITSVSGMRQNGTISSTGETRESGNHVAEDAVGAIVLAEMKDSPAVPLFLWGEKDSPWPPTVTTIGPNIGLKYEGTIPANGKIALLHWVATAGLDHKIKFERTFDLFWKDSRLLDLPLSKEAMAMVVNFKKESLSGTPGSPAENPAGRLLALEKTCEKLGLKRSSKDVLWLGRDEQLSGTATATEVSLEPREGGVLKLPFESVAALQGGGGRGRLHRVWLRDGSVLTGRLSLQKAQLESAAGTVALNAESLEFLLLQGKPEDGKAPEGAHSLLQTMDGRSLWLKSAPLQTLDMIATFGKVSIPAAELTGLTRKSEAPFAFQARLQDGSQIVGVPAETLWQVQSFPDGSFPLSTSLLQEWSAREPGPASNEPGSKMTLWDGSVLVGSLAGPVRLRTLAGLMEVKPEEVVSLSKKGDTDSLQCELQNGTRISGELASFAVGWNYRGKVLEVPAGQVVEMQAAKPSGGGKPVESSPSKPTAKVNIPETLPLGYDLDQLVDVTPEYPKPMFQSGPVSFKDLPNFEKPDPMVTKSRLTLKLPKDATNLAKDAAVTSSEPLPIVGSLDLVTDGDADGSDGCYVELPPGLQHVQVDLGAQYQLWKVLLWHYHKAAAAYHDVIVQVSDDPEFKTKVTTIFNNDHDNTAGFGKGPDVAYVETNHGRLMDAGGVKGRYVRFYSNGSTYSKINYYIEASVYGSPLP